MGPGLGYKLGWDGNRLVMRALATLSRHYKLSSLAQSLVKRWAPNFRVSEIKLVMYLVRFCPIEAMILSSALFKIVYQAISIVVALSGKSMPRILPLI